MRDTMEPSTADKHSFEIAEGFISICKLRKTDKIQSYAQNAYKKLHKSFGAAPEYFMQNYAAVANQLVALGS